MALDAQLERMTPTELDACDRAYGFYLRELTRVGLTASADVANAFYRAFHAARGKNQHSRKP